LFLLLVLSFAIVHFLQVSSFMHCRPKLAANVPALGEVANFVTENFRLR
jgi:hypothetical protein